jgi:hypothetical protein
MTREQARAIWAIYVWCRRTDELVDGPNASRITPKVRGGCGCAWVRGCVRVWVCGGVGVCARVCASARLFFEGGEGEGVDGQCIAALRAARACVAARPRRHAAPLHVRARITRTAAPPHHARATHTHPLQAAPNQPQHDDSTPARVRARRRSTAGRSAWRRCLRAARTTSSTRRSQTRSHTSPWTSSPSGAQLRGVVWRVWRVRRMCGRRCGLPTQPSRRAPAGCAAPPDSRCRCPAALLPSPVPRPRPRPRLRMARRL